VGLMGIFCFESVCQAEILEFSDHHAVVSDACISHLDGTVLIWPQENIDPSIGPSGYFRRSTITSIKVRYHPFRDGVPGHEEYNPEHARRSVLLRAAPFGDRGPPAPGSRPNVVWREQGVDGAAILGTFTMGAGTTRSRPGFDQYSSTWHGFLEPLLDVWAHVRRIHRTAGTDSVGSNAGGANKECPRYDVFLTDEVLGPRRDWIDKGYLTAFWRGLASLPEDAALSPVPGGGEGGGLWSLSDAVLDQVNLEDGSRRKERVFEAFHGMHSWNGVASGPLTCYKRILVGAPCCSEYPFNRRGGSDGAGDGLVLGPFGDCMLESQHHLDAMKRAVDFATNWFHSSHISVDTSRFSSRVSGEEKSAEERGFGEGWGVAAKPPTAPRRRRLAATSLEGLKVLVLDRDECDRRLVDPASLVSSLKLLFSKLSMQRDGLTPGDAAASLSSSSASALDSQGARPLRRHPRRRKAVEVKHALFERLPVAEQLALAADSDVVLAAHGGGEGWMAVMPKGAVLVELRHQGASKCFAPYARWSNVVRLTVDDLPLFANSSCHSSAAWTEGAKHIVPKWSLVGPAVIQAVDILTRHSSSSSRAQYSSENSTKTATKTAQKELRTQGSSPPHMKTLPPNAPSSRDEQQQQQQQQQRIGGGGGGSHSSSVAERRKSHEVQSKEPVEAGYAHGVHLRRERRREGRREQRMAMREKEQAMGGTAPPVQEIKGDEKIEWTQDDRRKHALRQFKYKHSLTY